MNRRCIVNTIKMDGKVLKVIAAVFIATTIGFAGLFAFEYSAYSSTQSNYSNLQGSYSSLVTTYDNVQGSIVLKDAFSHWDYIAIENLSLVMPQYMANATLHWIGGPLTGTYNGASQINSTWNKFFNLWSAVWFYTVNPPTVAVNGNSATVTSLNQFVLTPYTDQQQVQYLNVSYTLNYDKMGQNWYIQNEVWHIVGSGYISYTGAQVAALEAQTNVTAAAFSHWNNIAIENSALIAPEYAQNATLRWEGGPLTGDYSGISNITATWNKFFNIWSAVWFYATSPPSVTITGNYANVTSDNQFILTPFSNQSQVQYLNITYTLDFVHTGSLWLIYNEIWHISGSGYISFAQETSEYNTLSSLAFNHWNNIAIENTTAVMEEYASNATLYWVHGPLAGNYTGLTAINSTWSKFFGLWSAVWFYSENQPVITISGNNAYVNSVVQFVVQNASNSSQFKYINVTYTIDYHSTGFNAKTGTFTYLIVYEEFNNTAEGPLSRV